MVPPAPPTSSSASIPNLRKHKAKENAHTPLLSSSSSSPSFSAPPPPPEYDTFGGDKHSPSTLTTTNMVNSKSPTRMTSEETRLFASFWLFGTVVVMQFGVVVTAANDLVGQSAPTGLILFAYTLPSILIRMFVPYINFPSISHFLPWRQQRRKAYSTIAPLEEQGARVDYTTRLTLCAVSSFVGLQLLAWCENIGVRVMGIAAASLSSNLGDMSFFQLATRYPTMITQSMGGYAAGSGAAGLIGSFVYTLLTGASVGASPSSVLSGVGLVPAVLLLVYFFVLPKPSKNGVSKDGSSLIGELGLADKLRIVRPLVWGYMAPLAALMFLENITTQGILPTILYRLPLPSPLSTLFTTSRDFYPFFFTTYQLAIFLGRSSITLFRLPGHNRGSCAAYWTLVATEILCLLALLTHSISMALPSADDGVVGKIAAVAGCVFIMGLCGGLGMSNTYWRVGRKRLPAGVWDALEAARLRVVERVEEEGVWEIEDEFPRLHCHTHHQGQGYNSSRPRCRKSPSESELPLISPQYENEDGESGYPPRDMQPGDETEQEKKWTQEEQTAVREFLISTIALPDVAAIFVASLLSLWVQPALCQLQMGAGRGGCGGV